jgi:predicted Abi (CAAX) family protease
VHITVALRVTDVRWFRDSTQIVLPAGILGDYRDELKQRFMITVVDEQDTTRLIGSLVVIPEVRDWLVAHGIVAPTSE